MKVFVTGGTGYVGSAVALRLKKAGHDVSALVRSKEKGGKLQAAGIKLVVGDLGNPAGYAATAYGAQAFVHVAQDHGPAMVDLDRKAISTARELLRGSVGGTFIYTSGVWVLGDTGDEPVDEKHPPKPPSAVAWRPAHEQAALELAKDGIRAVVVRPGIVYGGPGGGIPAMLFGTASKHGATQIPGEGNNHWTMVHRDDLAELYVRLVERAPAGSIFHGNDASTHTLRDIAKACSKVAGKGEVSVLPLDKARAQMGPLADAFALDQKVSSEKARTELDWRPRHEDFIAEADKVYSDWHAAQ
ncbi:MAG TPA: NAD-dependent epimerase/dehydratase family protein [Myxococcales bacterium]|jgi:nucleoside-diphosphate-sugar epimerase|nr:NAD-dependent epimerase/dehydratase family protein [Myxococcales bacterium]HZX67154.1 NAD-dependent epimerase/dehydratase family protein [Myxococcales bacterium]